VNRAEQAIPELLLAPLRAPRAAYRRIGYMRARRPRPLGTRPAIELAVCAIFRDEARYLAEWVTFHRLQGVERFYLYDNRSSDDWRSELAPEIAAGIVEVTDWPPHPGQLSAYDDCLERHRGDARWIAAIDIDEFLFSPTGEPLPEVLQGFDTDPAVAVNRRFFGTNGHRHPPDGLVIESYPMRSRDDDPANALVKSIVFPRMTRNARSAHTFRVRGVPVGEDGLPVPTATREPATADLLRINHYYAKSEEEFRRKSTRPRADSGTVTERMSAPADELRDEAILRFGRQLRAALASREVDAADAPSPSMWSQLAPLAEGRRRWIAGLGFGSVLSGLTESGMLAILAQVAAALVAGSSQVHVAALHVDASVGALLTVALGLALLRFALQVLIAFVPSRIAADAQAELRRSLFVAFTGASWDVQSRDREGQLQELATNQIGQATAGLLQAMQLVVAALTFAVLLVSALALNPLAALIVLVIAAGLFTLLRPLNDLGRRRGRALSRGWVEYAGGVNESVRLAEEVQVFGVGGAQRGTVGGLIASVKKSYYQTQLLTRLTAGVYQGVIYLLVVLALAILYKSGAGNAASLGAVVLLLVRASGYGQQVQANYQGLHQSLPALERVREAQRRYEASAPQTGARQLKAVRTLAFERVSFAYEAARPVLFDLDFEVAAGETIGIVGPTGAGKSTLVQILLGLRPPSSGSFLVDGVSAARFSREDWHRAVAYLPQEPRLLHTSVAANIRFYRPLDDEAIERAARLAGIHDDIVGWPGGYETIVGPRADAVSGGQQQRICFARALAARPEILVLDEPTSALDPNTERLIQDSLNGLKHELTMFVVAHRMSTLDVCDRVMVIVDGRLEAFDTASALHVNSGYFRSASQSTVVRSVAAGAPPPPVPQGGG
jgi:ABC-type multidrug transport system fused ATPase/permease subunit